MGKIRVYKLNAHGVGAVPEGYWANTSGDADTIERLGFDYVQDKLLNQEIDKSTILGKTVKGGATC